jgi:hypothetical protein
MQHVEGSLLEGTEPEVMMSTIFWDITPCSLLIVNRRFRGIYHLHLQVQTISQGEIRWQVELASWQAFTLVYCSAYSSTLKMEAMFLRNVG